MGSPPIGGAVPSSQFAPKLQLPLEPYGYPASNPGPKTLLVNDKNGANLDALMWHMGRFSGYVGIVNYMGGRFMSEPEALRPVLAEMKKRGHDI